MTSEGLSPRNVLSSSVVPDPSDLRMEVELDDADEPVTDEEARSYVRLLTEQMPEPLPVEEALGIVVLNPRFRKTWTYELLTGLRQGAQDE
jgi:hypothetical protein